MLEPVVVDEKFRLEDVHAIEFREQVGCRVRHRAEGVFGMGLFPRNERFVSSLKIQVVHLPIPGLEIGGFDGGCGKTREDRSERSQDKR